MAQLILAELTVKNNFRAKVEQIMKILGDKGEPAKLGSTGRTKAEQARMVANGVSKTMKSAHRVDLHPDGKSHAADVVSKARGWGASPRFWLLLGHLARLKGLHWGGLYGRTVWQKRAIVNAIDALTAAGWPTDEEVEPIRARLRTGQPVNPDELAKVQVMKHYNVARGWDPAHISLEKSNW